MIAFFIFSGHCLNLKSFNVRLSILFCSEISSEIPVLLQIQLFFQIYLVSLGLTMAIVKRFDSQKQECGILVS